MQQIAHPIMLVVMKKNMIRGPVVTLAAVAALGGGLWWANVSQETEPAATPSVAASAAPAPAPPASEPTKSPAPVQFPATADYVGKVPIKNGTITLDISVDGQKAVAYACDGDTVEVWMRGSATDGTLALTSKDGASRLDGRLQGSTVTGTLAIGQRSWDFTSAPVEAPAGLYVYEENGVRNSWIVDADGAVTGVARQPDGSTAPAPPLSPNATRIAGDSDV